MRIFRNSDQPVTVRWFKANPDAEFLPFQTPMNVLLWSDAPYNRTGLGEVFLDYPHFERVDTPPTALGVHPCPADRDTWENGGIYDPALPPAIRDTFGVLRCCNDPGPTNCLVIAKGFYQIVEI